MELSIGNRLKHAWNVFKGSERVTRYDYGSTTSGTGRPDRSSGRGYNNERKLVAAIYNRIAIDVAAIEILHVRVDDNKRFVDEIDSGLNTCLTLEANIDQAARAFRQDICMSLFETGVIAIVPVETSISPNESGGYDIKTMRVGRVLDWRPTHVRVDLYNEQSGDREQLILAKKTIGIVENPLYTVMNETNSTLQRLIRKLNYLDAIDKQSSSGKLDLIIQLPYAVKSDARKAGVNARRDELEAQLSNSQYGVAWADSTEKITQLNRPAENNMLAQVQYLTELLYAELGITAAVMDGTADESTMLNYYNRTVEPILAAITEAMRRSFLTATARTQKQTLMYFRDPFKLVPISNIADIADKFTRNEILSSNEVRGLIGFKPSKDPQADELRNKNIPEPVPPTEVEVKQPEDETVKDQDQEVEEDIQNGS